MQLCTESRLSSRNRDRLSFRKNSDVHDRTNIQTLNQSRLLTLRNPHAINFHLSISSKVRDRRDGQTISGSRKGILASIIHTRKLILLAGDNTFLGLR